MRSWKIKLSGIAGICGIKEFFIPTKSDRINGILGISGICGILEFFISRVVAIIIGMLGISGIFGILCEVEV